MSVLNSASTTMLANARLTDRMSFPTWYAQLKYHAQAQQIWDQINPELPAPSNPLAAAPTVPDLASASSEELKLYQIKLTIHGQLVNKLQGIWTWVYATVDPSLLELAILQSEDQSLYELLRALRKDLCPSAEDWKEQVRLTYREVINRPLSGVSTGTSRWMLDWNRAYANAKSVDLDEIKGTLPIRDFLRAVSRFEPTWAERELENLARPGEALNALTIDQYAEWFSQLAHRKEIRQSVYATLGGRTELGKHSCPCRENAQHSWRPVDCARLEYALRGTSGREIRAPPTAEESEAIKERLDQEQWKSVQEALEKKGWHSRIQYPGTIQA